MVRSGDWIILGDLNLCADTGETRGLFILYNFSNKQLRDTLILIHAVKMQAL